MTGRVLFMCKIPKLLSAIFIVFWLAGLVYAQDKLQVYKNSVPQHGSYYQSNGSKWQRYNNYSPKFGDYLRQESNKMQIYRNFVPQYGDFYRNGIKYDNYSPDYGSRLKSPPNASYPYLPSSSISNSTSTQSYSFPTHSYGTQEFSSIFMPFFFNKMREKEKAEREELIHLISSGAVPYSVPAMGERRLTPEGKRLKQLTSEVAAKIYGDIGRMNARQWVQQKYIDHLVNFNALLEEFNNLAKALLEEVNKVDVNKETVTSIEGKILSYGEKFDAINAEYRAISDWAVRMGYVDKSDCAKGLGSSGFILKESFDPSLNPPMVIEDPPPGFWRSLVTRMGSFFSRGVQPGSSLDAPVSTPEEEGRKVVSEKPIE